MTPQIGSTGLGDLRPGDKVGHYELIQPIGRGGTSVVWKGYDALLDRPVAIKHLVAIAGEINDDASDGEAVSERFRAEMQAFRELSERVQNVVRLLDGVENERGRFIVMEYVEGRTLEQVLAQSDEPVPLKSAVKTIRAVARVLSDVHAQGVIHRDVKPSNVLLPSNGGLLLCDLGLASLVDAQEALTVGTARYLAPELCRGEAADARADLYALGILAVEMVAGRDQFSTVFRSIVRDNKRQAMRWVKWHTNPRLTLPPLTELNPDCPAWLSELVSRLIEKDPTRRLRSARDVVEAIDRHAQATPASHSEAQASADGGGVTLSAADAHAPAVEIGTQATAMLPRRRTRWPVWGASAAGAIVVLAAAGWVFLSPGNAQRAAIERRAEAVSLMRAAQEQYASGRYGEATATYQSVLEGWPEEADLTRPAQAGRLLAESRVAMAEAEYERAKTVLARLDAMDVVAVNEVYDLIREVERRLTFQGHATDIETRIASGQFAEARRLIREWRQVTLTVDEDAQLRELSVRLEDQVAQVLVDDVIGRAERMTAQGQRQEAIEALTRAQNRYHSPRIGALLDRLVTDRDFEAALTRAEQLKATADPVAVAQAYEAVLAVRPDAAVRQELNDLKARIALDQGRALLEVGDVDEARAAFVRATGFAEAPEARRHLAAMDARDRFGLHVRAGDAALESHQYAEAAEQYRLAMEAQDNAAIREKHTLAQAKALVAEGDRLLQAGSMEEAKAAYAQAQALSRSVPEAGAALQEIDRQTRYRAHLQDGDALRAKSRLGDAKRAYFEARGLMATDEVQRRIADVEFHQALAQVRVYIDEEEWAAARAMARLASNIYPEHPDLIELQRRLEGLASEDQG